jgi:ElaB/YqjD/DUF883 family membrane-anchored ribosome-binding protein
MGDPLPVKGDIAPHYVDPDSPEGASETRRLMREVGGNAKSKAKEVAHKTTDELRHRSDDYVKTTSGKVRNLEKAVRDAAGRTSGEQPHQLTHGATYVADRLDGVAGYLDRKNTDEILDDAGRFVRSNPGLVLSALAVTGFLAGRFLRVGDAHPSASNTAASNA